MVVDPIWVLISKVQNDIDTQHTPVLDSVDVGCIVLMSCINKICIDVVAWYEVHMLTAQRPRP